MHPTADFEADHTSGYAPLTVQFTDQSTEGSSFITSWLWDFGDGGGGTLQNPTHTYDTAGTYTVTLTVTTYVGSHSETKSQYITVNPPVSPTAAFVAEPTSGMAPLTVQFMMKMKKKLP